MLNDIKAALACSGLFDCSMNRIESKPFVVACIPAYDEEGRVGGVVVRAMKHVDRVVVCDDGSVDLTGAIAEELGAVVLRHERNMGCSADILDG